MIATRILDNDMGAVSKVPLTGRGTVHGITMSFEFVTGQEKNPVTGKIQDVIERVSLPEIDMGLVEMLSADMGVRRFTDHAEEHLGNAERERKFIDAYQSFVTPINNSQRSY